MKFSRQFDQMDCGPACIRMVASAYGHRWEVDEFHGHLEGLTLAELEVPSADTEFAIPPFLGPEVTGDPRYYNSQLRKHPASA